MGGQMYYKGQPGGPPYPAAAPPGGGPRPGPLGELNGLFLLQSIGQGSHFVE